MSTLKLTQGPSTPSTIPPRRPFNLHHRHHQKRRAKVQIAQALQGFAVGRRHPTCTLRLTSHTLRVQKHDDSQSLQVIRVTRSRVRDPTAIALTTMARKRHAAPTLTVGDRSKTSKRICSPINQRGQRNVRSPIVRTITRASLANTTKIGIP